MKTWQGILTGIFLGLLFTGVILLLLLPQRGVPIQLVTATPGYSQSETPTITLIQVHVAGAVKNPGLYSFLPGSRYQDGINAAGGLTAEANLDLINLSAFLSDGQRLYVPAEGQVLPTDETLRENSNSLIQSTIININSANLDLLMTLPGIGETRAEAIIAFRNQNGPFTVVEELLNVDGIGPSVLQEIMPYIVIGP